MVALLGLLVRIRSSPDPEQLAIENWKFIAAMLDAMDEEPCVSWWRDELFAANRDFRALVFGSEREGTGPFSGQAEGDGKRLLDVIDEIFRGIVQTLIYNIP
jgi:hypothetical protein